MITFELGALVVTRAVDIAMKEDRVFTDFVLRSLDRYVQKDWGDTCENDATANDEALSNNDDRLLAVYKHDNKTIWIITEVDRSATTILFPEDY